MGMTHGTGPMTSATEDSLRLHVERVGWHVEPFGDRPPGSSSASLRPVAARTAPKSPAFLCAKGGLMADR
jgi:hypothetical protein